MLIALMMAAAVAGQFDLDCAGNQTGDPAVQGGPPLVQAVTSHYRIDLTTKQWCDTKCEGVSKIIVLDDNQISLMNLRPGGPNEYWTLWVNRRTGVMRENFHMMPGLYYRGEYACQRQPFSGFPAKKF
jgi:hypothetical protein